MPTRDVPDDGPDSGDDWPEAPDRWAEADQAYQEKWAEVPDDGAAPKPGRPAGGTPTQATSKPSFYVNGREVPASTPLGSYLHGMQGAGPYLGLGVQIAGSMALFAGGGYAVDRWLDSSPWGILVGAMLGMAGIVALLVRVSREADRKR